MPAVPPGLLLGIDIGATKIAAGLGTADGEIQDRRIAPTVREDPARLVEDIAGLVAALRASRDEVPRAIGVGCCGRVSPGPGRVESSLALGWPRAVALARLVAERTGVPVFVDNDVNAGALGELAWGAGRGCAHLVYVSVGTGIGAGIVAGGRLHGGATGSAGEVGHMVIDLHGPPCPCGNRGCLEALASGKAIGLAVTAELRAGPVASELAALAARAGAVTARDVFAAAAAGDAYARRVVARTGDYLAVAVANLVNLFDPERVIIGGGLTHTKDLLLDAVRAALSRWTAGPADGTWTVAPAGLGADAGMAGAMAVALRGLADEV